MSIPRKAVFRTLVYADIFDYPLNSEELYRFMITEKLLSDSKFNQGLSRIKTNHQRIQTNGKYYFLNGREKIVSIRKEREKWSRQKTGIARKIGKWLKIIPWIKMVAITGSLAINNSNEADDIDLLIVTAKNRLWLSRGMVAFLLRILGIYRRPNKIKDKICPNMFLDEDHLIMPENERDLFSAHEIVQLKPIWDKSGVYQQFLKDNQWVRDYLPNGMKIVQNSKGKVKNYNLKFKTLLTLTFNFIFCLLNFNFFEKLAHQLQLGYMKPRRTTEIIEPGRVLFHPRDARKWILVEYEKKLGKLGIKD